MLLRSLGKHECKYLRRKYFSDDNNSVMTERDYDKSLKEEFDMEIQLEAF